MKKRIGVLLTNTGTPDSPTVTDVRAYLKAFLSDPRIVRLPKLLWRPLLHTVVLRLRAPYTAKLYQKIWTPQGSPLRATTLALTAKIEKYLQENDDQLPIFIEAGMHYGNPSIPAGLNKLQQKNITDLIVLPLFPQYSTSTTEAARDQVTFALKQKKLTLPTTFIPHYAEDPAYIDALVQQIKQFHHWDHHLLFSFHGLPQRFADQGDPYPALCEKTALLVAQALQLPASNWSLAYQSRFGYGQWLAPDVFETLKQLPQRGFRGVSVICPGFSVDCLETLEEIQMRGKATFLKQGGRDFHYIPALNTNDLHILALVKLLKKYLFIK